MIILTVKRCIESYVRQVNDITSHVKADLQYTRLAVQFSASVNPDENMCFKDCKKFFTLF